jgi:BON domain
VFVWKRCVPALLVTMGSLLVTPTSHSQTPAPMEPGRLGVDPGSVIAPPASASLNQRIADAIAEQLRQSGHLRRYQVNIVYRDGVADLTGQVADAAQRDEVLRLVQAVPGVERVRDGLVVSAGRTGVQLVQTEEPPLQSPALQGPGLQGPALEQQPKLEQGPPVFPLPGPTPLPEPAPIFQADPGALPNPAMQPPRLPPYAWPTYAPYNNYSRVAYPEQYPYEAWPFIGPNYPFPKVPLGWRSIQLTWRDGYWWYGKYATGHDWWRIRYR